MDANKLEKIISNTVFTMEMEGFVVTEEEKNTLRDVLCGKSSFPAQLQKYLEEARLLGGAINANI